MVNHILIITSDASDAQALQNVLSQENKNNAFNIEWVTRLSAGLERLRGDGIDAILVNLSLPDSQGIATFDQLFAIVPHTPILVLDIAENEMLATEVMGRGAQGCLAKAYFSSNLVPQSLSNIIQRKAVEKSLFIEKKRAEITLNSIGDAVISTDMAGNVDYLNVAAESMTGWSKEEAYGHPISEVMQIISGKTRESAPNPVELVLQRGKVMALAMGTILIHRDGREVAIEDSAAPIHDVNGKIVGAVIVFHDITAAQSMVAKMKHLAQHDSLTNLPNRVLLDDRVTQAIALAKRRGTELALLFLDLDNFKHINDSLGHATGDKLLQTVAQRLCACVRHADTVSRLGGDEFVILMTQDKQAQNATLTADKILAALAMPYSILEYDLHVTTSIGISIYPADGQDAGALLKNADIAMYHAKKNGRNNYQFFKDEMNVRAVARLAIETDLRHALEQQQFVLHYQPKVNLESGLITGAEALLRWVHPDWGMVMPDRFVQVAEDCGLIVPIGRWVLRETCAQAKRWEDTGLKLDSIAVNISVLEFRNKDFVDSVRVILNETGLNSCHLQLEITESVLMQDIESNVMILQQLKNIGIKLAVDDFGTGYSSLKYLHQFPIDVLKIDQSFIQSIGCGDGAAAAYSNGSIVRAIISMGASLKQRVIAEGVENQQQLAFLKMHCCDEGQGYFFSRPVAAAQFAQLLATGLCDQQTIGRSEQFQSKSEILSANQILEG